MMEHNKKKRNDFFLIFIFLVIACSFLILQYLCARDGAKVVVMQDGEVLCEFMLTDVYKGEGAFRIESKAGYNLLEINAGHASVIEADCPDGLCVKQKAISKHGESIICLPHKLVITIEGEEENEIDSFAY